jgi:hypothetical protein
VQEEVRAGIDQATIAACWLLQGTIGVLQKGIGDASDIVIHRRPVGRPSGEVQLKTESNETKKKSLLRWIRAIEADQQRAQSHGNAAVVKVGRNTKRWQNLL